MGVFKELEARGLIAQMTDPERIEHLLENERVTFYIGFDPTADSLHVGHFLQMVIMKHMQMAGHCPIALFGGGTGMVGDPSGRTDMRQMLTHEKIEYNISRFVEQMGRFIDLSDGKAVVVNNGDWLFKLNYIDFLREVGPHFTVNRMLAAECYKSRMDSGLTVLEFNYMLMQAYDFLVLFKKHNCLMQMGGDDQWSNILAGKELVRRTDSKEVYGITFKLLTTSDGKKMGKTQKGALWLDPEKTPPYEFYQYWRNIDDADVMNCLRMLTFLPLDEISAMEQWEGSEINRAKEILAYELTKQVHGQAHADKAQQAAKALFSGGENTEDMPTTVLEAQDFNDGQILITQLLVRTGLAPSKSEARRLVQQGGIFIGNDKIAQENALISTENLMPEAIIKKGKKTFHRVVVK